MPQDFFSQRACTACTLLPSTLVCHSGDALLPRLLHTTGTSPPPSPGPTAEPHSCCPWLLAAATLLLTPVTPLHHHPTPSASQVSYIRTIRHTPIFLPNLEGKSASYSLKNTVNQCTACFIDKVLLI